MTARFTHSTATISGGTARYLAPELFQVENTVRTHYGSDVYAFACVCYEVGLIFYSLAETLADAIPKVLTGNAPFYELRSDMAVMMRVRHGYRPSRPMACSGTPGFDGLWELMENCCDQNAQTRLTASEIVKRLAGPSIVAQTRTVATDWDDKFTAKFRRSVQAEPLMPSVSQIEHMLFDEGKFLLAQSICSDRVRQKWAKAEFHNEVKLRAKNEQGTGRFSIHSAAGPLLFPCALSGLETQAPA
jgi:serine/threonine protein kinase